MSDNQAFADCWVELEQAKAENSQLRAQLKQEERNSTRTVDQRDAAEEWADKLAYAIGGEEIGEHSSWNNPWENALEMAEAYQQKLAQAEAANAELRAALDAWVDFAAFYIDKKDWEGKEILRDSYLLCSTATRKALASDAGAALLEELRRLRDTLAQASEHLKELCSGPCCGSLPCKDCAINSARMVIRNGLKAKEGR